MSLYDVPRETRHKAFLVAIQLPGVSDLEMRSSMDELARLVNTLGHDVVGRTSQKRTGTGSRTVLGEGKLAELARLTGGPGAKALGHKPTVHPKAHPKAQNSAEDQGDEDEDDFDDRDEEFDDTIESVDETDLGVTEVEEGKGGPRPTLLIFDHELTPSQLRNLERACGCTVMDRTGVIIEIFSRHARTRTARLQVEIAKLTYLAPRIRETGGGEDRGGGGVGGRGAGESSIELDKRKIRDRIKELRQEFSSIGREHETRRARRSEVRTVALVGYTNAGKSSLMRALTGSEVLVADKLFATLDTTVRPLHPPSRPPVLISDTVGFIKKLPHDLVASFKSTLDEALNASLLLFVVDSSDPSFRSQLEVTKTVLAEVGVEKVPSLIVLNKRDRLSEDDARAFATEFPEAIQISTRDPEDVRRMRDRILRDFEGDMVDEELFVPWATQGAIGEIRARIRVLQESYVEDGVKFLVRATPEDLAKLKGRFGI